MLTIPTGCTVKHTFVTEDPAVLEYIKNLYVTYVQAGQTVIEKTLDSVIIEDGQIIVPLSQEDTLLFDPRKGLVRYQIRIAYTDGTADKTAVMTCSCDELLKGGVI